MIAPPSRLVRSIVGGLALLGLVGACSIREDARPRPIPDDETVVFGASATGDEATGDRSIYLLAPTSSDEQPQLRSVRRQDASSDPLELLRSLLAGPNEDEAGLTTAIPDALAIQDARTVGNRVTIDMNDALNELSDVGLRLALAQIVATASEIDEVRQVRLRVDGENRSWPTGSGEVTDVPLTVYDYPGFVETSQPAFPSLPTT
ncbi:GerMN domain-containing protein [Ilumatobacter sp.]|uniref:GerMN domain-containing protein n=1 Tax=Ilumatobacter sp. TaxID=1967498 RepID=UPI003B515C93